eukprot:Skav224598  [mRNA]  locus=scaffold2684:290412:295149:+ [translate_table: standard]
MSAPPSPTERVTRTRRAPPRPDIHGGNGCHCPWPHWKNLYQSRAVRLLWLPPRLRQRDAIGQAQRRRGAEGRPNDAELRVRSPRLELRCKTLFRCGLMGCLTLPW